MKDIIIVGAGGFGIEAIGIIKSINAIEPTWNVLGFIDDNPTGLKHHDCGYKIIGSINEWQPKDNEWFVLGIANPQTKEKIVTILKSKTAQFATIISPKASVGFNVKIGEGCVIGASWIAPYATIGNFVHVAGSMVGSGEIGDFSTTTGFANLTNAHIGRRVFIGSHAVILNGRHVGDDAFVCAGSIVFNHIKAGTKVLGNPAKKMDF